ncbi:DNA-directed RNA polymerase III subunit RPC1 [Halotydeus destructor]|nr:DNA-directed RNA polymerase III subunit RPC1 [Halotydeus destructor]
MTPSQLRWFLEECLDKYLRAKLEPATAVGAICAQSIGEPATQMTLKTFHFAGVASMNITQGVPRIKELINANKTISTPIIHAALLNDTDPDWARSVKMRLEKTTLGEVCEYLEEVVLPDEAFVLIKLYSKNISVLKLEVNADSVVESIMKSLKLSPNNLSIESDSVITVRPQVSSELWQLRENLGKVVIKGVSSIKRAAIRVDVKEGIQSHYLAIEGEGLRSVMATYGVDPRRTCSNNVLEVAQVLGIEAGRSIIIREIMETMQGHGISIDERHLKLLADTMTYRGEVLGITRFGLAKMKESALMLASFERTADHLFDAAYFGQEDAIIGVSESIISGVAMKVGTGFFDLVFDSMDEGYPELHRKPVFDDADFHSDFTYQIDAAHAPHV